MMDGNPFFTDAIREKANAAASASMENIGNAWDGGVKVAFGTDSGVTPHGDNAQEFALMVGVGMTEMEAIHAATVAAADLIDRSDDLGTLEPGKIADLIAVDADPLADITSLENVSVVIKEGRRVK